MTPKVMIWTSVVLSGLAHLNHGLRGEAAAADAEFCRALGARLGIPTLMGEADVDGDPAHSSETTKAQKTLAAAEVQVEEVEGNPGYYSAKFFLRPHYQLEGLTVSLRLVSKLPSAKAG